MVTSKAPKTGYPKLGSGTNHLTTASTTITGSHGMKNDDSKPVGPVNETVNDTNLMIPQHHE
jgi:hypothetical protein